MFELSEKQIHFHPALSAQQLLSEPYFAKLLAKISSYAGIQDRHYEALYTKLIDDFAVFVQAIPIHSKGKPGTLLAYSLERAAQALEKYHQENQKIFDIRYAYAIFTAALLQDLGKIIGQQKVMICDAEGRFLEDWLPSTGAMPQDKYYRLWFLSDKWINVSKHSTLILARQIMSPSGFNWLVEDLPTYKMWLEALAGDGLGEGNKLLSFLALVKGTDETAMASKGALSLVLKPHFPKATKDADIFVDWLVQGLNDGTIPVNVARASVYVMETGALFLVCPQIFEQFCERNPLSPAWEIVCSQFNQLGLTSALGEQVNFDQYLIQQAQTNHADNQAKAAVSQYFTQRHPSPTLSSEAPGALSMAQMMREGLVLIQPDILDKLTLAATPFEFKPVSRGVDLKRRAQKQLDDLLALEEQRVLRLQVEGGKAG